LNVTLYGEYEVSLGRLKLEAWLQLYKAKRFVTCTVEI